MPKKLEPLDPTLKEAFHFDRGTPDVEVYTWWKTATSRYCKPCWELRYCPYGPMVEESPVIGVTRTEAIEHTKRLRRILRANRFDNGEPLDDERRSELRRMVRSFDPTRYPESIPDMFMQMNCNVFGHVCPVVFVAEDLTETTDDRRTGRYIPFKTKIRIVRRDNYTCQHCGVHLLDNEVEFDHIIPIAKGGSSEEHNLRLTCHKCNSDKSDHYEV